MVGGEPQSRQTEKGKLCQKNRMIHNGDVFS